MEESGSISLGDLLRLLGGKTSGKRTVPKESKPKKKKRSRKKRPVPSPPPEETFSEMLARHRQQKQAWIDRNGDEEELCPSCEKVHLIRYQFAEGGCRIPSPRKPVPPPPPPKVDEEPPLPLPPRLSKRKARPSGSKAGSDDTGYIPRRYSVNLPHRRGSNW